VSVVARRCVVIGTGMIGASLAAAAKQAGVVGHVVGVGRSSANLETARRRGLVDAVSQDPLTAVVDADLVVLATPADSAVDMLGALAAAAPPGAVFTDVGSVKEPIMDAARSCGLESRFVGGHPIAGGTTSGAEGADAALFRARTVVLTSTDSTDPTAIARVRSLWEAVGARIVESSAGRHDQLLALTSHLPQFVVFALCAAVARAAEAPSAFFGSGFQDTTRLATSDHEMWLAIARLNRGPLVDRMDAFADVWTSLRKAVADGDDALLLAILREARIGKERSKT
jgi:prephenate dehydrogenase